TYTNVLTLLDLAGIPIRSRDRRSLFPIVMAGGSGALNPEPMADFFDVFLMGEGEELLVEFCQLVEEYKAVLRTRGITQPGRAEREEFLRAACRVPGVYVPEFYRFAYDIDGKVTRIDPVTPEAPRVVSKRQVIDLPPVLTTPVVPFMQVVHDRASIEIQRGCTRGCRFCQAGYVYRSVRERPPEEVVEAVGELLSNTGYEEVSLLSLSTADYSRVRELVEKIAGRYRTEQVVISLPSLRIDAFSVELAETLAKVQLKRQGFTFAPEAGSERLRRAVNKYVPEEVILEAVAQAVQRGWDHLKFYFMVGLPTETLEDVQGIVDMVGKASLRARRASGRAPRIRVGVSTFVPKAHTPFQWMAQDRPDALRQKQDLLRRGLRKVSAHFSWVDPTEASVEALLSLGDRRVGDVIYRAWRKGCRFDAWSEHFRFDKWMEALAEAGLDLDFYAYRERPLDEVLPWSHIDGGVTYAFLRKEHKKTSTGAETPDCRREPCQVCGFQAKDEVCARKFEDLIAFVQARKAAAGAARPAAGAAIT
ncbi:MAG: TIGR03960 family B12-binding radical SAM protein, partial [Chloroflexi bacterium]|nr:TIGR03960 family B12-binding radical SAM protein [Chloroflexota bacterium]